MVTILITKYIFQIRDEIPTYYMKMQTRAPTHIIPPSRHLPAISIKQEVHLCNSIKSRVGTSLKYESPNVGELEFNWSIQMS